MHMLGLASARPTLSITALIGCDEKREDEDTEGNVNLAPHI